MFKGRIVILTLVTYDTANVGLIGLLFAIVCSDLTSNLCVFCSVLGVLLKRPMPGL